MHNASNNQQRKGSEMTKNQVNAIVAEAVEYLQKAQPGRPAIERQAARQKANELLAPLTITDLRKINDDMSAMLLAYA